MGVIHHFRGPDFLAGFGVECSDLCVQAAKENLAVVVRNAAVDNVATSILFNAFVPSMVSMKMQKYLVKLREITELKISIL